MTVLQARNLPNLLTCFRLVLAVAFVAILSLASRADAALLTAAAVFVVAAITDAVDGWLARRLNAITPFGRVMDPLADKVLVLAAFVLLAGPLFHDSGRQLSGVQPWMAVVILARELVVTSLRGLAESRGVDFSATASGKAKMIAQSIAVPAILTITALRADEGAGINTVIAWTTTLITVWSGAPYVARALPLLREPA